MRVNQYAAASIFRPANLNHHEAHQEHEVGKHFFRFDTLSVLSDLRVLRALRGEQVFVEWQIRDNPRKTSGTSENSQIQ
jgi:hypothetical protein